jgi:hypothetical protein
MRHNKAPRPCTAGDMTFGNRCLNCGMGGPAPISSDSLARRALWEKSKQPVCTCDQPNLKCPIHDEAFTEEEIR